MVKKIRILFLFLIFCAFSFHSTAQIRGVVKDGKDLKPIKGVNILVLDNQNIGAETDSNGVFTIGIRSFPVRLQLSSLGYETRVFTIFAKDDDVTIYLKPTTVNLDEIVVTHDRLTNPITQASTISRSTVDVTQLTSKSVTTAVELLRAETGVFVQQTSVGQGSIYIRGRAGRDVLYLFNGFRMNPSFVRSGQNQYFGAVDPFLIQRIDVYRGPVSIYYGSDALSGGVNISPLVKDFSEEDTLSGQVLSAFNFNGNGEKTLHGKLAYQTENFSILAGGSFRDFDYYKMSSESNSDLWFPYDETLDNADYQFRSYQISSRIRTGDQSDVTLISYYGEIPHAPRLDRITMGYAIEEETPPPTPREGYDSNTEPLLFWGNTAEFSTETNFNLFESFNFKVGYFKLKDHRKSQAYAYYNSPHYSHEIKDYSFSLSDTVLYDRNTSDQILTSFDFQSPLSKNFLIEWGGDFSYDVVSSDSYNSLQDESLPRYPNGSEYILGGVFTQLDQQMGDKLNLEYGIRYSFAHANIPFEGSGTVRPFGAYSSSYSQVTGSFGISYSLNSFAKLVSNISTGFRAPNIADLSEVGDRGSNLFQTTNIDLQPEKTLNYDIGFRHDNGKLDTEIVAYWLHYFDKIDRTYTGDIVNQNGAFIRSGTTTANADEYAEVYNENANSMDLLGIEARGDFSFTSSMQSGLTFTYTWGRLNKNDGTHEPVNRVPPANGLIYFEYTPVRHISVRPQVRYAFTHTRISQDEIDDVRVSKDGTPGFANLQMIFNIRTDENVNFKLVADNLTDTAYREHASSLDGLGRNITFSVSYGF